MEQKRAIRNGWRMAGAMLLILTAASAAAASRQPRGGSKPPTADYSDAYAAGYAKGYEEGYATGYEAGCSLSAATGTTASGSADTTTSGAAGTNDSGATGTTTSGSAGTTNASGNASPNPGKQPVAFCDPALGPASSPTPGPENPLSPDDSDPAFHEKTPAGTATRLIHRLGAEFRPEYILPTNPFLSGTNRAGKPIETSLSAHLRYSLRFRPGSAPDRIYTDANQGIGVARYAFGNGEEVGNPIAVYLFQGARIVRLAPRLSFDYEWNFGLSFGWVPYDRTTNSFNVMTGSKMNAYLNVDLYLRWLLSQRIELTAGFTLTHFSNGNTKFPNAGLNAAGLKLGLAFNFDAEAAFMAPRQPRALRPGFPRHVSYDLTLFGSWRRKGVELGERQLPSPEAYTVVGFNFAAMYNFGYKFRAGLSADGVYDGSANVYTENYIVSVGGQDPGYTFYNPGVDKQLSLGLSARTEFVMPYFTVGFGLGMNVLHKGGDLKAFYQAVTLKIAATRSSYVHIGYCLKDFQTPNYLMLGIGYRFNNKYPRLK